MIKILESESDFEKIINKGKWLVDFYADWCGPCQLFGRIAKEIDFINILKINVDRFSNIAKEYGVMSIPTLYFFNNGKQMERKIGLLTKEEVKEISDKI